MEKDWVVLKIDDQRMWVSLTIKEPIGEEPPYFSPEFIESYLRENGITAGINRESVEALSQHVAYGKEIIVARGKPAVNGQDGFYQYTVMIEDSKSKPVINPDGSVDYYNSLKLAMVDKDELFAVYIPPTAGEYGYTVFSEMLQPVKGKELRPLRGKGFYTSEDGREYRACYRGRIVKNENRITIDKIYIVKGDLDIEKGNINFNGDVEIMGDVRSGLSIVTDGNIFVHGHVGGSILAAGGSITIRKGIQGRNKCDIEAKGDVVCSFIERCIIKAGGNVYADSILDSDVTAKQKIIVSSRKGLVVGGIVTGVQGVIVKEAGNETGVLTVLQAGIVQEELELQTALVQEREKLIETIELLNKNLKVYDNLDGNKRTKETEALRMKIFRAKVIKVTELKSVDEQLNKVGAAIDSARRDALIEVTGLSHAGIKINIGRTHLITKETWKDVVYKSINEKIVVKSGDEK
ncbi:MAG: DUF342 domain-containing protein [Lachnospiraceae bacterium]|nr:DUF342 domain-containing protein [Lachnospiraceae bacterium]